MRRTRRTPTYLGLSQLAELHPDEHIDLQKDLQKDTHTGDPNKAGVFGCHDCMGPVRLRDFDAVIGLGGKRPWRGHQGIAFKVTWVGISPIKSEAPEPRFGVRS
jgi:hypothetical protein